MSTPSNRRAGRTTTTRIRSPKGKHTDEVHYVGPLAQDADEATREIVRAMLEAEGWDEDRISSHMKNVVEPALAEEE